MHTLIIRSKEIAERACNIIKALPFEPLYEVVIRPYKSKRSLEQNARMWAMLEDISRQVDWYGKRLTKEEWKDVFTAALKRQKVVPGLDGGFVVLGTHTSKMSIAEMSELTELMFSFGAERKVKWSDPTLPEE